MKYLIIYLFLGLITSIIITYLTYKYCGDIIEDEYYIWSAVITFAIWPIFSLSILFGIIFSFIKNLIDKQNN